MSVHNARSLYLVLIWLFVGCLIVQVFLVGLDLFGEADPATHRTWAYIYGWLTPVLVFLASVGRLPRPMLVGTVALLVLFAVQTLLPSLRDEFPVVAAAHALNALLIFWLAMVLARRARDAAADRAPREV
jgi:heme A synthase